MTLIDNTHYLPPEDYAKPIEALHQFTVLVLFSFAVQSDDLKERIIRNFIARGMTCLESIFSAWKLGNIQDCWILQRSLVDRLFHLKYLADVNEFELFDKWSFIRQFEANHKILSDPLLMGKLKAGSQSLNRSEKIRYDQLKREKVEWTRPQAEKVAKDMNLPFLYKISFDHASAHVHPMANDGEEDFLRMTGLESEPHFDSRVVLHNSLVIQVLLIQQGLNASGLHWRGIVYDLLDDYVKLFENGTQGYLVTLAKIFNAGPDFPLCQLPGNE